MPVPKPQPGQSQDEFVQSCMANETMNREFPDGPQRFAVCNQAWRDRDKMVQEVLKKYYGDATGPLGTPMQSAAAKELEALIKTLPADCRTALTEAGGPLRLGFAAKVADVDENDRTEKSFVTTDSIDRDNEVLVMGGIDWKTFRKNPVVTFNHLYHELPVGRALWVQRETRNKRDGFLAKTRYTPRPEEWRDAPWLPDAVWHFVKSGDMPGKSIGFIPQEVRPPSEKEIKDRPELAGVHRIIAKCTALEYAVCTVQSNPDAVVQAIGQKAVIVPSIFLEAMGLEIPGLDDPALEKPPAGKNLLDIHPVATASSLFDYVRRRVKAAIPGIIRDEIDRLAGRR